MTDNQKFALVFLGALALLAVFVLAVPRSEDDNSLAARVQRATGKVSEGISDAGKELKPESQKSFEEKVGDAVEDAGKNIKGTR